MLNFVLSLRILSHLPNYGRPSPRACRLFTRLKKNLMTNPVNYWSFRRFEQYVKFVEREDEAAARGFLELCLVYIQSDQINNIESSLKIKPSNIEAHLEHKRKLESFLSWLLFS